MALSGREILSLLWLPGYTTRPETIIRQQGLLHPNWRRRPDSNRGMGVLQTPALPLGYAAGFSFWSGRRDLNPRPSPWQGDALPLSYSRPLPKDLSGLRTVLHYKEMPAKKKAPGSPGLCIHSPKQDYQPYAWRKKNHQMSRAATIHQSICIHSPKTGLPAFTAGGRRGTR